MQELSLKFISSGVFFHIFAIANQLRGFSISRLTNAEDFFHVNLFFKSKYQCEYKQLVI